MEVRKRKNKKRTPWPTASCRRRHRHSPRCPGWSTRPRSVRDGKSRQKHKERKGITPRIQNPSWRVRRLPGERAPWPYGRRRRNRPTSRRQLTRGHSQEKKSRTITKILCTMPLSCLLLFPVQVTRRPNDCLTVPSATQRLFLAPSMALAAQSLSKSLFTSPFVRGGQTRCQAANKGNDQSAPCVRGDHLPARVNGETVTSVDSLFSRPVRILTRKDATGLQQVWGAK